MFKELCAEYVRRVRRQVAMTSDDKDKVAMELFYVFVGALAASEGHDVRETYVHRDDPNSSFLKDRLGYLDVIEKALDGPVDAVEESQGAAWGMFEELDDVQKRLVGATCTLLFGLWRNRRAISLQNEWDGAPQSENPKVRLWRSTPSLVKVLCGPEGCFDGPEDMISRLTSVAEALEMPVWTPIDPQQRSDFPEMPVRTPDDPQQRSDPRETKTKRQEQQSNNLVVVGLIEKACKDNDFRYRRTEDAFIVEIEDSGLTQTIEYDEYCISFQTEYTPVPRHQLKEVRSLVEEYNNNTLKIGTVTIRRGFLGCRTGITLFNGATVDEQSIVNHMLLGPNIIRVFVKDLYGNR